MTITVGDAATLTEKEVKTRYPVVEGLTGGTQKQTGRTTNLVPQTSLVKQRLRVGIR